MPFTPAIYVPRGVPYSEALLIYKLFAGSTGGSLTITFNGAPSTTLDTLTFASFGSFQTFVTGSGIGVSNIPFALMVTQTGPTAGSGSFAAMFSGLFTASNSGIGIVTFTVFPTDLPVPPVTIGGFVYSIPGSRDIHLVPPASNNGITTVQGFVSGSAAPEPVPEPTTLLLLTTGLAGIAGVVRKRFKS